MKPISKLDTSFLEWLEDEERFTAIFDKIKFLALEWSADEDNDGLGLTILNQEEWFIIKYLEKYRLTLDELILIWDDIYTVWVNKMMENFHGIYSFRELIHKQQETIKSNDLYMLRFFFKKIIKLDSKNLDIPLYRKEYINALAQTKKTNQKILENLQDRYSKKHLNSQSDTVQILMETAKTILIEIKWEESIKQLAELDFNNYETVLNWIEAYYEHLDPNSKDLIIKTFNDHGHKKSENINGDFNMNDERNLAIFIIGQALRWLELGDIPEIVITRIVKWRKMFRKEK